MAFKKLTEEDPTDLKIDVLMKKVLQTDQLPPITGLISPGKVILLVNSVEFLDDIFVN